MPYRLSLLVLLAASLAAGQPGPDTTSLLDSRTAQLLPPNSAMVLGIHWRKLVESGMFDQVKSQLLTQAAPAFPGLAQLEDVLLNQVDAIVLAGSADALQQMNKAAGGPSKRNPPMLVVIKGRFNLAALRAWAGEKKGATESYQDVELLRMRGANPPTLRWSMIDGGTLLLGERRDLVAAIDRRRAPAGALSPLLARSAELAARSDFWMHMQMPPLSPAGPPTPADQFLKDLKSVDVGMTFSDGLRLDANLLAANGEAAQKLALALQAMLAMAAQGEGRNTEAEQMLRRLRIQPQGSYVSLAFAMSKSELDRLTAERLRARGSAPPTGPVGARPPDPPGPKTIRITGLEGGPVEIPVDGAK